MGSNADAPPRARPLLWTAAVFAITAPLVATLCLALWRTPFPVSEAVALFEDVANQPATRFLTPDTSYYRPLFQMTLSAIWHNAGSLELRLALIKLLQLVPFVLLVALLIAHLRPRTGGDAAAAAVAVAVLIGSPGLRDNLEIPLSYTTVGMPLALIVWMLVSAERRPWQLPAIVLVTLVAIGFKEQGLVLIPVVLAAWWTRAPGASGRTAATLATLAAAYVALRLSWQGSWPMFEQAVGLGFGEMEPTELVARYGAFPYFIYAYSGASTVLNVLFAEPTRGTFSIVRALVRGNAQHWQMVHLASSVALTGLIGWWGAGALKGAARHGWSKEARLVVVLAVALLACGALSFNYSRDRLGGMAVPFYAVAAYYALRQAARRAADARPLRFAVAGVALMALAAGWHLRAVGTIERARLIASRNQVEWLVQLQARRIEFAERATYLRIMESMLPQGTDGIAEQPTRYPPAVGRLIGEMYP